MRMPSDAARALVMSAIGAHLDAFTCAAQRGGYRGCTQPAQNGLQAGRRHHVQYYAGHANRVRCTTDHYH